MRQRRRKRHLLSSSAIDWRDPAMPVLREYRMADGSIRREVDPEYERRYREHMMKAAEQPGWRDDPTYKGK